MNCSTYFSAIASVCVLASACDSSVDLQPDTTTEAEALELAAATLFATFNSTSVIPPRPASSLASESTSLGWMTSFEAEVRCPGGGRVGMAASVQVRTDPDSGGGVAEYRLGQVHQDCRVQPGRDAVFAISGGPRLEARVEARHDGGGGVEWGGEASGRIHWSFSERRGSCEFDVRFTGEAEGPGRTVATVTGSVCGHAIESVVAIR